METYPFYPPCGDISESVVFLITILYFPIFTVLSLNLYISGEGWVHGRKLTLLHPLGKAPSVL